MPEAALRPVAVAAYAVVALLAFDAGRRASRRERATWMIIAAVLLLLGAAKWVHTQEAIADAARQLLVSGGWYAKHREVQTAAAVLVGGTAVGAAFLLWRWLRGAAPSLLIACAALGLLLAFIAIRAASIHDVDSWVTAPVAGMRKGWWVELAALLVIAGSALTYSAKRALRR